MFFQVPFKKIKLNNIRFSSPETLFSCKWSLFCIYNIEIVLGGVREDNFRKHIKQTRIQNPQAFSQRVPPGDILG